MSHPQDLSLREQAARVASGELDPVELLEATLERHAERDGAILSTPVTFPERARSRAAERPAGPLGGVPLTVKDMFALPWRGPHNGTAREQLPAGASGVFTRLRDAGAVVVGIANQHELGMGTTGRSSVWGPAGNPHDPARCAGGSSGGSAAGVAARIVAGSIGSDSAGSTRLPASWCGVVGLKLTWGAVPREGYTGGTTTLSAAGAFGRDAADTRLLASVLAARPFPAGDGAGLTVGLVRDPFWSDVDPGVEARCRDALAAAGWRAVEPEIEHGELASIAAGARVSAELGAALDPAVVAKLDPFTRALVKHLSLWPAVRLTRADRVRAALRRSTAAAFGCCEVLAWPATPATAPLISNPTVTLPSGVTIADPPNLRQASLANATGVPGISVPVGAHPSDGLPVGLQLLAPWGEEARLLDAAAHLERALG